MRVVRMLPLTLLVVLLLGGAYITWWIVDTPDSILVPLPTATVVGPTLASQNTLPDLMEVRLHYCQGITTYALLALPSDATFSMGVGTTSASVRATATGAAQIPITGPAQQAPAVVAVPSPALVSTAACEEAGTVGGRQLVLCRGQGPTRLTLSVRSATGSGMYVLALRTCGPQPPLTPTPTR